MSSMTRTLTFGLIVFALGFLVGRSQPPARAEEPMAGPGLGEGVILETGGGMLRLASEPPGKAFVMFANAAGEEAAAELAALAAEPSGEGAEWHFPLDKFESMTIGVAERFVQVQGLAGRGPEATRERPIADPSGPIRKDCMPGLCTPPADGLMARFYLREMGATPEMQTIYCTECCRLPDKCSGQ